MFYHRVCRLYCTIIVDNNDVSSWFFDLYVTVWLGQTYFDIKRFCMLQHRVIFDCHMCAHPVLKWFKVQWSAQFHKVLSICMLLNLIN